MKDLLFFGPTLLGVGIIALGYRMQIPKGMAMNRRLFGLALILGALCFAFANAAVLVFDHGHYLIFNVLTVFVFFAGLAFQCPARPGATTPREHSLPGNLLLWAGLILGIAHSIALTSSPAWRTALLAFYARLGLHA